MLSRLKQLTDRIEKLIWSRKAYRFHIREWTRLTDLDGAAQLLNSVRFSRVLIPVEMSAPQGKRITVIAPHPDDEAIGPGGTLLMATDRGCTVTVIYVTNGVAGDAAARIEETRQVCGELGWSAVRLGGVAAALEVSADRANALGKAIKESSPDIVMIPYVLDDNEDHRKATALWLNSAEPPPHAEVWAYQVYSVVIPNVVVDITGVRARKSRMIGLYTSQMQRRDWSNFALGRDAWSSRWLSGRKSAAWAEGFFVLPAAEYLAHAKIYFDANSNSPTA